MQTSIGELIEYLHSIAPNHFQEDYDNSGLIVGSTDTPISGCLVCLDATEEVVDECISLGYNLIVAHHPIVFRGLKRFNGSNYVERTVIKAIKNNIAIFAIHTNLDNVMISGVNEMICDRLNLLDKKVLMPKPNVYHDGNEVGAGMVGSLKEPMAPEDFLHYLSDSLELKVVKHTAFTKDKVQRIAVCGGSGSFLVNAAKKAKADVYISADFKYHEYFDAENDIIIADIGHFESEKYTINLLYNHIINKFSNFAARRTKVITNPIKYFIK